jgi:hypothetical protein
MATATTALTRQQRRDLLKKSMAAADTIQHAGHPATSEPSPAHGPSPALAHEIDPMDPKPSPPVSSTDPPKGTPPPYSPKSSVSELIQALCANDSLSEGSTPHNSTGHEESEDTPMNLSIPSSPLDKDVEPAITLKIDNNQVSSPEQKDNSQTMTKQVDTTYATNGPTNPNDAMTHAKDLSPKKQREKKKPHRIPTPNGDPQYDGVSNEAILAKLDKLSQALADVRKDMYSNQKAYEAQMDSLEKSMLVKQETLLNQVNAKIEAIENIARRSAAEVVECNDKIVQLNATIAGQNTRINDLCEKLSKGDLTARAAAKAAIKAANDIEAHNRRWALRILGLPAPTTHETTAEAKQIAVNFITERLSINGITTVDIDCAHRVGTITDAKQTLLVRFFERDYVDLLKSKKKSLKGTGLILYEDATFLDRKLILALKDHPDVESAWMNHGKIWAKSRAEKKVKVQIFDDLEQIFK